jgi:hypothetical protein
MYYMELHEKIGILYVINAKHCKLVSKNWDLDLLIKCNVMWRWSKTKRHSYGMFLQQIRCKQRIVVNIFVVCMTLVYFTKNTEMLQEDSVDNGKVTSAGMYFLGFSIYRFEHNYSVSH